MILIQDRNPIMPWKMSLVLMWATDPFLYFLQQLHILPERWQHWGNVFILNFSGLNYVLKCIYRIHRNYFLKMDFIIGNMFYSCSVSSDASRVKDTWHHETFVYHTIIVNLYFYQGSCSNICTNNLSWFSAREYIWTQEPYQIEHYILRPVCDIFWT